MQKKQKQTKKAYLIDKNRIVPWYEVLTFFPIADDFPKLEYPEKENEVRGQKF